MRQVFIHGDLWLVEGDRLLGLVRFQKVIESNAQRELAFDKDLDWAEQVQAWWLVGGTDHLGDYGKHGGRLACTNAPRHCTFGNLESCWVSNV